MTTILGVLSDSHGRVGITAQAISMLLEKGANLLIHLGDVETDAVIDELVGHNARLVFGNCDWNTGPLISYAESVGVQVDHPVGKLKIDGKVIVYTHGHLQDEMDKALTDKVDYLLHGHSHELRDEKIGKTRIINPGALFRANRYTAAILEPATDRLEVVEIPRKCD